MTRQEAFDKTYALFKDFDGLRFNVSNDNDLHDCTQSKRFSEKLWALCRLIITESLFSELCDEVEDDKSLFAVQKKSKEFFDEVLLKYIDGVITISKQWQFHDYRLINLQSEARVLAKEIRDFYVEIYR